jgi:hypothetical protein
LRGHLAEHQCDLAGRRGGSGRLPSTTPERSCPITNLCARCLAQLPASAEGHSFFALACCPLPQRNILLRARFARAPSLRSRPLACPLPPQTGTPSLRSLRSRSRPSL